MHSPFQPLEAQGNKGRREIKAQREEGMKIQKRGDQGPTELKGWSWALQPTTQWSSLSISNKVKCFLIKYFLTADDKLASWEFYSAKFQGHMDRPTRSLLFGHVLATKRTRANEGHKGYQIKRSGVESYKPQDRARHSVHIVPRKHASWPKQMSLCHHVLSKGRRGS